jgi:opacity protein-like surface antigen
MATSFKVYIPFSRMAVEKPAKKEVPVKVEKKKVVKKPPPPPVKKKEVKKEKKPLEKKEKTKIMPTVETFVNYLINNKKTLKYKKFKKVARKGSIIVQVYCDAAAKNRLLGIIENFKAQKYNITVLKPGKEYRFDAVYRAKGPLRMKEEAALSRFRIGASVGYYSMFDSNFKDVYGSMISFGLDLSVTLSDKLDIWASGAVSSKTAAIDWHEEDLKFNFTPLSLDLRYFFKRSPTWDFFAGAGFNLYPFKDTNPIEEVKGNAFGFNILGGTYYHLTNGLSLQFLLRFNIVKKAIEDADNDLNMTSAELLFGLSYGF